MASFFAWHLLTVKIRWIVSALYLLATFVYVSRWYYDAVDLFAFAETLARAGIDVPTPIATLVGRVVLMFFGTLAALYFIHFEPMNDDR